MGFIKKKLQEFNNENRALSIEPKTICKDNKGVKKGHYVFLSQKKKPFFSRLTNNRRTLQ